MSESREINTREPRHQDVHISRNISMAAKRRGRLKVWIYGKLPNISEARVDSGVADDENPEQCLMLKGLFVWGEGCVLDVRDGDTGRWYLRNS